MQTALLSIIPIIAGEEKQPGGGMMHFFFLMAAMFAIMWFLLIRPQKKHQRERMAMIQSLQKHDQIITRGGILGTVTDVRPEREEITVEIAKNTRVRMRRAAVEAVLPRDGGEAKGNGDINR